MHVRNVTSVLLPGAFVTRGFILRENAFASTVTNSSEPATEDCTFSEPIDEGYKSFTFMDLWDIVEPKITWERTDTHLLVCSPMTTDL